MRHTILMIISAALLLTLQSCSKLAFPSHSDSTHITSPSSLNGNYSNRSNDSTVPNNTLWAIFGRKAGEYQFKPDFNQSNLSVKLTATGKREISAQLYQGSVFIDQRRLKGRIEDSNSFRLKQRSHNPGVPFIYMKLSRYGVRLRQNDNGRLLVDVVDSHGKMIFILAGGQTDDYSFSYLQQ